MSELQHHTPGSGYHVFTTNWEPPNCCYKCAKLLPWTEKNIAAARELVWDLEELNLDEKQTVIEGLKELLLDPKGNKASLFEHRVNKNLVKAKGMVLPALAKFINEVLIHAAAEAVLKGVGLK